MIDKAMSFLKDQLDAYIQLKTGEQNKVELINVADAQGAYLIGNDKLGISLVTIEEERIAKAQHPYGEPVNGSSQKRNPEIKLNLYLLFAVNPQMKTGTGSINNYEDGLRLLTLAIGFFQGKYYFDTANSPGLDPKIKKMILDLYTLPIEQQNYLWGAIGAKYLPSVVYRVRLISIQEDILQQSGPSISTIDNESRHL